MDVTPRRANPHAMAARNSLELLARIHGSRPASFWIDWGCSTMDPCAPGANPTWVGRRKSLPPRPPGGPGRPAHFLTGSGLPAASLSGTGRLLASPGGTREG